MLAANAFRIFPAFIFKNALAANIGIGSRLKVSGFRRQDADRQLVVQVREVEIGSFNVKQMGFARGSPTRARIERLGRDGRELARILGRKKSAKTAKPRGYMHKLG